MISRIYRGNRIHYIGQKGDDIDFWRDHWENVDWRAWLDGARAGVLGYFEEPFVKYLPKQGKILEAGCGLGQLVVALRARGYDAEGVEFSEKTVSMVKQYLNDLPIKVGDVKKLDYPDDCFSAYVSLGVMEHFAEGPEPVLREAYRVLNDGGYLLVSVPMIHAIRRIKIWLRLYSDVADGAFYQYAFSNRDFKKILENEKFAIIGRYHYGWLKGVKDEIPLFRRLYSSNRIPAGMVERIEKGRLFKRFVSHMMLFVARKKRRDECDE